MNIIAVDDEFPTLYLLEKAIREAVPEGRLAGFASAREALAYAEGHQVDIAFLDIEMASFDGLTLAGRLKEIRGETNIIFVTGHSRYAAEAFALHASGYILKPVEPIDILREMENLRHPVQAQSAHRVRVNCFGSFAVFVDDKPLLISGAKVKELFAYLVHKNGAAATSAEIASVLWEDRESSQSVKSNTRNVIAQLSRLLKDAGVGDILQRGWNSIAIDAERIACDYHEVLRGNAAALNAYMGEYLREYSWAEWTAAFLNKRV